MLMKSSNKNTVIFTEKSLVGVVFRLLTFFLLHFVVTAVFQFPPFFPNSAFFTFFSIFQKKKVISILEEKNAHREECSFFSSFFSVN